MKAFLIFFLFALAYNSRAQTITFTYDEAGNRLTQSLIVSKICESDQKIGISNDVKPNIQQEVVLFDNKTILGNIEVLVSPNPTSDHVRINIKNLSESDNSIIFLNEVNGQLLFKQENVSNNSSINLTTYDKGAYVLTILINGKKESWKILKQ